MPIVRVLAESKISDDLSQSYGYENVARYSIPGTFISVVCKESFEKGDVLDVEPLEGQPYLVAEKIDEEASGVPFLVPLSTNVPLHQDSEYEFEATQGSDLVIVRRSEHPKSPLVSYLLMVASRGPLFKVKGRETETKTEILWSVDVGKELDIYG